MKKIIVSLLILPVCLFVLSTHPVFAQNFCKGDFNYNGSVAAEDVTVFLEHFGRSPFNNPCPSDGPAPVARTGQTASYIKGDDGYSEKGVAWPYPRFRDNGDGTIIDKLTGLMWLKDANCIASEYKGFDTDWTWEDGIVTWEHAFDFINGINDGTYANCGEGHTGWRLPNIIELQSLIHYGYWDPSLPNTEGTGKWSEGDPFSNLPYASLYWTSSSCESLSGGFFYAYYVDFLNGINGCYEKSYGRLVWPVRGGH